jgi:hypothetical protein
LLQRYFVRWHMSAILAATVGSGLLLDRGFLAGGFTDMAWRYALSVLGAYAVFFLLVRLWVWYAAGIPIDVGMDADSTRAEMAGAAVEVGVEAAMDGGVRLPGGGIDLDVDMEEGWWVMVVLAVVVLLICGAGAYLIWMAPEILPEVALECAIGAGLVRQLREPSAGWAVRLLVRTWIPLLLVAGAAFGAGAYLQGTCPGATNVRAVIHCAATQ